MNSAGEFDEPFYANHLFTFDAIEIPMPRNRPGHRVHPSQTIRAAHATNNLNILDLTPANRTVYKTRLCEMSWAVMVSFPELFPSLGSLALPALLWN